MRSLRTRRASARAECQYAICYGLKRYEEALATSEQTSTLDPRVAVALVSKVESLRALVCDAEAGAAPLRPRRLGLEGRQATQTNASPSY